MFVGLHYRGKCLVNLSKMSQRPQNGRNKAKSNITNRVHKRNRAVGPWSDPSSSTSGPLSQQKSSAPPAPTRTSADKRWSPQPGSSSLVQDPSRATYRIDTAIVETGNKMRFFPVQNDTKKQKAKTKTVQRESDKSKDESSRMSFNAYLSSDQQDITVYDPVIAPTQLTFHEYLNL
ncbi:hypothetical protein ScPMuIL_014968 [Solemya velum]